MSTQLSTAVLTLLLVLPAVVAGRVSRIFFSDAEPWRRCMAGFCLYPLVIYFVLLGLSPLRAVTLWPVLAAMGTLALLSWVLPGSRARVPAERAQPDGAGFPRLSRPALLAGCLLGGALLYHAIKLYVAGPYFFSDDYAYHGPAITAWLRTGTLEHPLLNFAAYYPLNPHLLTLYLCLPTANLEWVWLATVYWLALAAGAVVALGAAWPGFRLPLLAACAALFLISSEVTWFGTVLCPTDIAGAVALLASFVFIIPRPGADTRELIGGALIAGLLLGFAVGTKVNYAPAAGLTFAAAVFFLVRRTTGSMPGAGNFRTARPALLALGAGMFATGSYWYMRNLVLTGNPVFPVELGPFKGPATARTFQDGKLTSFLAKQFSELELWQGIVSMSLNWPTMLGVFALAGAACTAPVFGRQIWLGARQRSWHHLEQPLLWLFAAALVTVLLYPFLPFSGAYIGSKTLLISRRYVLFSFLAALIACAWVLSRLCGNRRAELITVCGLVIFAGLHWPRDTFGLAAAGLAIAGGMVAALLQRVSGVRIRRIGWLLLPVVPLLLFALFAARVSFKTGPFLTIIQHDVTRRFEPAMRFIDTLPAGSRVSQFTMCTWETWALSGSRFQMQPVILDMHGREMLPLHEAFRQRLMKTERYPKLGVPYQDVAPDTERFATNLRAASPDYILVSKYVGEEAWPLQREPLRKIGDYAVIYDDGYSEIYARMESGS